MSLRVGVFGGSFDPVHVGHINCASELVKLLKLDQLCLMPCGQHAFKKQSYFSNAQRLEMLNLAVEGLPQLLIDSRELNSDGVSYSVESCREIRQQLGENAAIFFVIGSDLLASLHLWRDWNKLLDIVNLVVINRAAEPAVGVVGSSSQLKLDATVQALLNNAQAELHKLYGGVMVVNLTPNPVSSTAVRQQLGTLEQGDNNAQLSQMLPSAVYNYLNNM